MGRLDGKAATVTGAGNGLGRAVALAAAGARVVLNDLAADDVHPVADEIMVGGGADHRRGVRGARRRRRGDGPAPGPDHGAGRRARFGRRNAGPGFGPPGARPAVPRAPNSADGTALRAGFADGMRALDSVHRALGPLFPGAPDSADGTAPRAGFACEDTLVPATETIGFGAPGGGGLGQGAAG